MAAWPRWKRPRGWPQGPCYPDPPAAFQAAGAALSADGMLAGQRIALRSLDIASIAAGGGSIARVDAGGTLGVGPESAGSVPGPACYGNGGVAATVTDANIVLGFLDAGAFMGARAWSSNATKAFEDVGQFGGRDAGARVADR